jgi:hypothetical protein
MNFDIEVDASKANLRLEAMPPAVHDALVVAVTLAAGELEGRAQSKASGDLLQVRTGRFVKSIKASVSARANSVTGRVYSRDRRAALFEYGGRTPAHEIEPKRAKALLVRMRSGTVFAARVQHPGGAYSARNIIHSAFEEMRPEIIGDLEEAARGAVERP